MRATTNKRMFPAKSRVPAVRAKPTSERNNPPSSKSRVPAANEKPTSERNNPPPAKSIFHPPRQMVKGQPSSLNDRLASYIECVRNLEIESLQLHAHLQGIPRGQRTKGNKVVGLYEARVGELRNQLDIVTGEKARLELDRDNAVADYDVVRDQLSKMELELGTVHRNSTRLHEHVQELLRRASSAERANADLLETVRGLKCANAKLTADYKALIDLRVLDLDKELQAVDKLLGGRGKRFRIPLPSVKAVLLSVGGAVVMGASLYVGYWCFLGDDDWSFGGNV